MYYGLRASGQIPHHSLVSLSTQAASAARQRYQALYQRCNTRSRADCQSWGQVRVQTLQQFVPHVPRTVSACASWEDRRTSEPCAFVQSIRCQCVLRRHENHFSGTSLQCPSTWWICFKQATMAGILFNPSRNLCTCTASHIWSVTVEKAAVRVASSN
jgi:hypothetical protein